VVNTGPYKSKDMPWEEIPGVRLLDRIEMGNEEQCWIWLGTTANDRPIITIHGRRWNAKRLMWSWWNSAAVPAGTVISQTCGNSLCMNKKHLVANSHSDAVSRGMARKFVRAS